jgi:hypothetical protein
MTRLTKLSTYYLASAGLFLVLDLITGHPGNSWVFFWLGAAIAAQVANAAIAEWYLRAIEILKEFVRMRSGGAP